MKTDDIEKVEELNNLNIDIFDTTKDKNQTQICVSEIMKKNEEDIRDNHEEKIETVLIMSMQKSSEM